MDAGRLHADLFFLVVQGVLGAPCFPGRANVRGPPTLGGNNCCGQCVSVCGSVGLRAVCVCVWLRGCVWQARLAGFVWMKMGLRDEDPTVAAVANVRFWNFRLN